MPMTINTCSGAISLSRELENQAAAFYQELSQQFEKNKDLFIGFANENLKFVKQIERAYYGVITDAIEGCFAFNLNEEEYQVKTALPAKMSVSDAVAEAGKIEENLLRFYQTAAEQSKHLMAGGARWFMLVAKKRTERIPKLKALVEAK